MDREREPPRSSFKLSSMRNDGDDRRGGGSPPRRRRSRSPGPGGRTERREGGDRDRDRGRAHDASGGGAGGAGEEWGSSQRGGEDAAPKPGPPVEKPNFGLSGALGKDKSSGNVFNGVALKWSEPPEACVPSLNWRLHVFKGDTQLDKPLHIHRQSAFLFGREHRVADIPIDHPSCSSQHAVLQYRRVEVEGKDGARKRVIKPCIMDLESTNGTHLNGERIPSMRYVELRVFDRLKFGCSTREYVLLHDQLV